MFLARRVSSTCCRLQWSGNGENNAYEDRVRKFYDQLIMERLTTNYWAGNWHGSLQCFWVQTRLTLNWLYMSNQCIIIPRIVCVICILFGCWSHMKTEVRLILSSRRHGFFACSSLVGVMWPRTRTIFSNVPHPQRNEVTMHVTAHG